MFEFYICTNPNWRQWHIRSLWSTQHFICRGPGQCCAAHPVWSSGLCCVPQMPWQLDTWKQCIVQRNLLAAPPLYWQLHHLHGLIFTWTCSEVSQDYHSISIVEIKKSCLLVFLDNPLIAGMTKRENLFHRGCLPSTSHISWRWCWSSQHLKGCFLQCVNIVNDALWTVSAFLLGPAGSTTKHHHVSILSLYLYCWLNTLQLARPWQLRALQ